MNEPVVAGGLEFVVGAMDCDRQYASATKADLDPRFEGMAVGEQPLNQFAPAKGQWCLARVKVTSKRDTSLRPANPHILEAFKRHKLVDEQGHEHPVDTATATQGLTLGPAEPLLLLVGITEFHPSPDQKVTIDSAEVILAFDVPKGARPVRIELFDLGDPFAEGAVVQVEESGEVFSRSYRQMQERYKKKFRDLRQPSGTPQPANPDTAPPA